MKLHHTLLASAALLASFAAQALQTVSVIPQSKHVNVGDTFTLDLQAQGFPDKIFGGGYDVAFNPSVLKLDDVIIPASWEFATSKGTLNAVAGTVTDIFFNTFAAPVKGDFLTTSLKFTAIGAGTSNVTLSDSPSFPFGDEFGNAVAVSYNNGTVTVAVPEPSSLTLLFTGVGLAGWACVRRRGRR